MFGNVCLAFETSLENLLKSSESGRKCSGNREKRYVYVNNSLHLARKYARIFVRGHYLFQEANSFRRLPNCELRGTDNVQGQISEHIFAPNGDYCIYYSSNLFRKARSFKNWGIFSDIL